MTSDALAILANKSAGSPAIIKELKGKNWQWIQTEPLFNVALRLLTISHTDPKAISSTCLALLAKRLIQSEVAVGGPYNDNGYTDIATNIILAQLLASLGQVPAALRIYINHNANQESIYLPRNITTWLLAWPHDIVSSPQKRHIILAGGTLSKHHRIPKRVLATIRTLKEPLQSECLKVWQSVNQANKNLEITNIATYFAQSLTVPLKDSTSSLYDDLGEANFYAWMAYTIYDDFIDGNGIDVRLNVANAMHRRSLLLYEKHAPNTINTWQYFDNMDEANAWELAYCRATIDGDTIYLGKLPNYRSLSMLAARSSAHIIGPLIVTASANSSYETLKTAEQGLRHYLIARQLNDDIHDWKSDILHGHLSPVVTHLLEKITINNSRATISDILPVMQRYFWQKGMVTVSRRIIYHTQKSKQLLLKNGFMNNNAIFFENIINPIELSAKQAIASQHANKKFLNIYKSLD